MAEQEKPVRRKVALKVIKAGMDTGQVVARFEAERQALAIMEHTNIARVLDVGATDTGRPFFVMELVNGVPITEYCDRDQLTPKERLELFVPVCQAVQHAHQKGIIHRDLKPSNILVTLIDGRPVPKVIDFGVAKAIAGRLTDESMETQFGAVIGTLEYMSPEQAGFSGVDIDTRADIYSLGVILYELLTGLRPIDAKRLQKAALTEMIRIIREEEPSKPSTRLSTDESRASLAALRQTEPRRLMALLRGELDWVVMKCLEKHRERRYETASALARDIERYLADEAVEARPPSAGYRLGKFLRRNRGPVLAASLVLLALVAGIVGTTYGLIRANRARAEEANQRGIAQANEAKALAAAEAERKAREREADQRAKAEKARDRTRQALDAMTSSVTGDSLTTQKEISAEQKNFLTEVLTYYQEFAGEKADDEPSRALTALAAFRVGLIEYRLGRTAEAVGAYRMAVDGYSRLAAVNAAEPVYRNQLAGSHMNLGIQLTGLGKRPEAEQQYRQGLAILEKLVAEFPAVSTYRSRLGAIHDNLGDLLRSLGKWAEAEQQYRKAVAIQEKLAGDFPAVPLYRKDLATSHNNLGMLLSQLRNGPEAEQQYLNALAIQEKLAAELPAVPDYRANLRRSHNNLGILLASLGKRPEALEHFQKALVIQQKLVAESPAVPGHRLELCRIHNNLGLLLKLMGRGPEAEEPYRNALVIQQGLVADFPAVPEHRKLLVVIHTNLGNLLADLGKGPEAEQQHRKAVAIAEKLATEFPAVPEYRQVLGNSRTNLGLWLAGMGKWPEAAAQNHKALAVEEQLAAEFPAVPQYRVELGGSYCNLGSLVSDSGRPGESLGWFDKAIRTLSAVYDQDRRLIEARQVLRNSHWQRAIALDRLRKFAEAITDWDTAIELSSAAEQPEMRAGRATSRLQAGQVAEAVAEVSELELTKSASGSPASWYSFACFYSIAAGKSSDQKQVYADRAMDLLQKAIKAGYNNAVHMAKDTDLDPIRGRDDFKTLIEALTKKSPAKREQTP
jgi:eukaryotic-like serine/threonine-protein kinase